MIEKIESYIAPVCRKMVKRNEQILTNLVEEEYIRLGKPRLDENLMLDLENLAMQKMLFIKKYGLEEDIINIKGKLNEINKQANI